MAPRLSFHGQPLADPHTAGSFLRSAIRDPDAGLLSVAVAWARFGGIARLAEDLRAFRDRGGSSTLIVGIDEGVATRPGLELALSLFDEVVLFHDLRGRTFHPKLYLVEGRSVSRLFVGSSNLTAAGLYLNFEASLQADFSLPGDANHEVLLDARSYLDALRSDTAALKIDAGLLAAVADDPRWRIIPTERRGEHPAESAGVAPDEIEGRIDSTEQTHFAATSAGITFPPPLSDPARALLDELETPAEQTEPRGETEVVPGSAALAWWSKTLTNTDAQHPPRPESNPTGNLRLSKAGHPIDHLTWFRRELFANQNWIVGIDSRGNPLETATVAMDVVVADSALGTIDIRVDHAPHREEGQNNVPTILHWGSSLGPILRAADYTGAVATIERLDSGSFRLTIS